MKAIRTSAVISGIRAKVDGSLGLSLSTPELSPVEKVAFMELQNINLTITVEPLEGAEEKIKIEKEMDGKSPSQRLYNVIHVFYKQSNSEETFDNFYRRHIEGLIDQYKSKLER